jgi:CRP/FNR family cyclic AMP-dependent transcriptional regulator
VWGCLPSRALIASLYGADVGAPLAAVGYGVRSNADMNVQQKAAVLARTELFQGVNETTLRWIAERARERIIDRGQVVFSQDEPGNRMFVLAEGAVKQYVSSGDNLVELARYYPVAVFGEVALLDSGPRPASAESVERCTLLVVTRAELMNLLHSEEQIADALLRSLCTIVRRTIHQVSDLVFLSLEGRVAAKVLDLAGSDARTRSVSHMELATMVGGSRQSVSRALRGLETRGYIRTAGQTIEILNREPVERLAGQ